MNQARCSMRAGQRWRRKTEKKRPCSLSSFVTHKTNCAHWAIRKTAAFYLNSAWFHVAEIGNANDELRDPAKPINRPVNARSDKLTKYALGIYAGLRYSDT